MNNQEIFDKVVKHLLTQNAKSITYDFNCKYRGLNGLKCAIGCLIDDEDYTPEIEGRNLNDFINLPVKPIFLQKLPKKSYRLLDHLQITHDSFGVSEWPGQLRYVATFFKLKYNGI